MNNQELSAMIAEEVSKAVAPLYEQLEQIKSKRSEIETETFEKGYYIIILYLYYFIIFK